MSFLDLVFDILGYGLYAVVLLIVVFATVQISSLVLKLLNLRKPFPEVLVVAGKLWDLFFKK